jgi:hypothetical protein
MYYKGPKYYVAKLLKLGEEAVQLLGRFSLMLHHDVTELSHGTRVAIIRARFQNH